MVVEADRGGAREILAPPVARHRDQHSVPHLRQRAEPMRERVAIRAWKSDVEERHVGTELDRLRDRTLRVLRGADLVTFQPQHLGERLDRIDVVVDDQYFAARGAGFRTARWTSREPRCRIAWQADLERAALALPRAVRAHAAAVEFDNASHKRQPDAETTLGARQRMIALRERVERALQKLGFHPLAAVDDPDCGHHA